MALEVGSTAKLIVPVIQGEIIDTQYNKEGRCLEHQLKWLDANGNEQLRWFKESELEEVVGA